MKTSITRNNQKLIRFFAVLFWIAVWQIASMLIRPKFLLVSPWEVVLCLGEMLGNSEFWSAVSFTFLRIVLGFFLATICGIGLAILSARFFLSKALLAPLTSFIKTTPVVSFIILALIWIPSKNLSVFISFLMVFPVIYTSVLAGIEQVDPKMLEMATTFHMRPLSRFVGIYLPAVLPYFLSSCKVALGLCWKSGIAAEVIGLPEGSIGEQLYQAMIFLGTRELFAWTAVVILLSVLFERCFIWAVQLCNRIIEEG